MVVSECSRGLLVTQGTSDAFVWMPMPKVDGRVELVGYSDSDWVGDAGAGRASPLEKSLRTEIF